MPGISGVSGLSGLSGIFGTGAGGGGGVTFEPLTSMLRGTGAGLSMPTYPFVSDPNLISISPNSVLVGAGNTTITLTGMNFTPASVAKFGGLSLTTFFTNSAFLTAIIPSSSLTSAEIASVSVLNPSTGYVSDSVSFTVNNPPPILTSVSPNNVNAGAGNTPVTLFGTYFNTQTVAIAGVTNLTTTFLTSSSVSCTIPSAMLVSAGTISFTVNNPVPGGGTSNAVLFTVNSLSGLPMPQYSVVFPGSNPTLAGWADTFTPLFTGTTPGASAPLLGTITQIGQPQEISNITGYQLVGGTTFAIAGGTTAGNQTLNFLTSDGSTTGNFSGYPHNNIASAIIPTAQITDSMYYVWAENSNGNSYPLAVNRAELWWCPATPAAVPWTTSQIQVVAGDTLRLYGAKLSFTDAQAFICQIELPSGGSGVTVTNSGTVTWTGGIGLGLWPLPSWPNGTVVTADAGNGNTIVGTITTNSAGTLTITASGSTGSGTFYGWTFAAQTTYGTGSKTFYTSPGRNFASAARVWVYDVNNLGNPDFYMFGTVTSYNGTTGALVLNITTSVGSGYITYANICGDAIVCWQDDNNGQQANLIPTKVTPAHIEITVPSVLSGTSNTAFQPVVNVSKTFSTTTTFPLNTVLLFFPDITTNHTTQFWGTVTGNVPGVSVTVTVNQVFLDQSATISNWHINCGYLIYAHNGHGGQYGWSQKPLRVFGDPGQTYGSNTVNLTACTGGAAAGLSTGLTCGTSTDTQAFGTGSNKTFTGLATGLGFVASMPVYAIANDYTPGTPFTAVLTTPSNHIIPISGNVVFTLNSPPANATFQTGQVVVCQGQAGTPGAIQGTVASYVQSTGVLTVTVESYVNNGVAVANWNIFGAVPCYMEGVVVSYTGSPATLVMTCTTSNPSTGSTSSWDLACDSLPAFNRMITLLNATQFATGHVNAGKYYLSASTNTFQGGNGIGLYLQGAGINSTFIQMIPGVAGGLNSRSNTKISDLTFTECACSGGVVQNVTALFSNPSYPLGVIYSYAINCNFYGGQSYTTPGGQLIGTGGTTYPYTIFDTCNFYAAWYVDGCVGANSPFLVAMMWCTGQHWGSYQSRGRLFTGFFSPGGNVSFIGNQTINFEPIVGYVNANAGEKIFLDEGAYGLQAAYVTSMSAPNVVNLGAVAPFHSLGYYNNHILQVTRGTGTGQSAVIISDTWATNGLLALDRNLDIQLDATSLINISNMFFNVHAWGNYLQGNTNGGAYGTASCGVNVNGGGFNWYVNNNKVRDLTNGIARIISSNPTIGVPEQSALGAGRCASPMFGLVYRNNIIDNCQHGVTILDAGPYAPQSATSLTLGLTTPITLVITFTSGQTGLSFPNGSPVVIYGQVSFNNGVANGTAVNGAIYGTVANSTTGSASFGFNPANGSLTVNVTSSTGAGTGTAWIIYGGTEAYTFLDVLVSGNTIVSLANPTFGFSYSTCVWFANGANTAQPLAMDLVGVCGNMGVKNTYALFDQFHVDKNPVTNQNPTHVIYNNNFNGDGTTNSTYLVSYINWNDILVGGNHAGYLN